MKKHNTISNMKEGDEDSCNLESAGAELEAEEDAPLLG